MQYATELTPVQRSDNFESTRMKFKASAKAFRIIIDGIYSDKIRAIVREIFTNAFDAHILANKERTPFKVTLPSMLNPEFVVRDYGPALDHEFMTTRYATVFDSTKDQSNEFVGSLGIGRLSPFAYTDAYVVTSYLDKVARTYSVFVDENGEPNVTQFNVSETEEENGFEVRVPVDPSDANAFWEATRKTCVGFETLPVFTNEGFEPYKVAHDHGGWRVMEGLSGTYARQGCVIYPLDSDLLIENGAMNYLVEMEGAVFDFPIGSLEFNAAREALGYKQKTMKVLTDYFKNLADSIVKDFQDKIDACRTKYEAAEVYRAAREALPVSMTKNFRFGGKLFEVTTLRQQKGMTICANRMKFKDSSRFSFVTEAKINLDFEEEFVLFFVRRYSDVKVISPRICEFLRVTNQHNKIAYTVFIDSPRELKRVLRYFGEAPMIDVSILPKPTHIRAYTPTQRGTMKVKIHSISERSYLSDLEDYTIPDITQEDYFVIKDRDKIVYNKAFQNDTIHSVFKRLKSYGRTEAILDTKSVVAVTFSQAERLLKNGWKNLGDDILPIVVEEEQKFVAKFGGWLNVKRADTFLPGISYYSDSWNQEVIERFPKDHPIRQIYEKHRDIEAKYSAANDARTFRTFQHVYIHDLPEPLEMTEYLKDRAAVRDYLPPIVLLSEWGQILKRNDSQTKILVDFLLEDWYKSSTQNVQLAA